MASRMYCLPFHRELIGAPVVPAASSVSHTAWGEWVALTDEEQRLREKRSCLA